MVGVFGFLLQTLIKMREHIDAEGTVYVFELSVGLRSSKKRLCGP